MDGNWIDDPILVKLEFKNYYQQLFIRQGAGDLVFPLVLTKRFRSLRDFIMNPFTRKEIKKVVWDFRGEKATGPDGFTFSFIRRFWEIIEDDMVSFVKSFF